MTPSQGPRDRARHDSGLLDIGGVPQWVILSGEGPPLLVLSGAGVAFSRMPALFAPWEAAFTVV